MGPTKVLNKIMSFGLASNIDGSSRENLAVWSAGIYRICGVHRAFFLRSPLCCRLPLLCSIDGSRNPDLRSLDSETKPPNRPRHAQILKPGQGICFGRIGVCCQSRACSKSLLHKNKGEPECAAQRGGSTIQRRHPPTPTKKEKAGQQLRTSAGCVPAAPWWPFVCLL